MKLKFLFLALLAQMITTKILAYDALIDGIYYNFSETEATVTSAGNNSYSGAVVIPQTVSYQDKTYDVTNIGKNAFSNCSSLTSVTISEGVRSIASYAFSNCSVLASITIPESVISIGYNAFFGTAWYNNQPDGTVYAGKVAYKWKGNMPLYTSIELADGTKGIADSFCSSTNLFSIVIPNSVVSIGQYAFENCGWLSSITIPSSVTSIGLGAFWYCGLTTVSLPNSITTIGERVFSNCEYLSSIDIPNSVTEIGKYAFENCSSLESLTIPSSVTTIGEDAFSYCSSLESITIPGSVTTSKKAFENCDGLTSVIIEMETIGEEAFKDCSNLTSVTISNSVRTIGNRAFAGCSSLASIIIPNNVSTIGAGVFQNCATLKSLTIPANVTNINGAITRACDALESITVDPGNTTYDSRDNCNAIIRKADNTLISGCKNTIIPNTVTTIGGSAFSGLQSLTSITIPYGVTAIGASAFMDCTGLTSITIPESVTTIGGSAFLQSGLVSISIPERVAKIQANTFYRCFQLESVTLSEGLTDISSSSFMNCEALTSITIPSTVTTIEPYGFKDCIGLRSVRFTGALPNLNYTFDGVGSASNPVPLIVPAEYSASYENAFINGRFSNGYLATNVSVNLAKAGYATYYHENVAVQLPSELSAKAVADVNNRTLTYAPVADNGGVVPAGTAVILCGPETDSPTPYTLTYVANDASYSDPNLLHGSDIATTTTGGEVFYKLTYGSESGHEDIFGWYWGAENGAAFNIGAHKAWLAVSREQAGLDGGGAGVKSFALPEYETVGIQDIEGQAPQSSAKIYDLQGRRIARPTRGLYIVNGKKVAI